MKNGIIEIELPTCLTHKEFFQSVTYFHDKVKDISCTIIDYCIKKKVKCQKEFFAILFEDNKFIETTENIDLSITDYETFKEKMELWITYSGEKITIYDHLYKIDIDNKILIFGVFSDLNSNGNKVMAGYLLPNNIDYRMLVFSLSNMGIAELKKATTKIFMAQKDV